MTADEFATLAERHLESVYRYALHLTGDRDAAEDVAAEAMARAWAARRRYDPARGEPVAWLCALARTVALDRFRADERRAARERRAAPLDDAGSDAIVEGFTPDLDRALRGLSRGEREVIALRVILDLPAAAAARVLGISPTAVSTRLSRALARLEEALRHVPA